MMAYKGSNCAALPILNLPFLQINIQYFQGKNHVPIEYEAVWASELVANCGGTKKFFPLPEFGHETVQTVPNRPVSTTLSRHQNQLVFSANFVVVLLLFLFCFRTALISNIGPRTYNRSGCVCLSRHFSEYYCKTELDRFIALPENYSDTYNSTVFIQIKQLRKRR
jgi:hypothetical protein